MNKNTESKLKRSYVFLDESGKPEVYSRKGVNLVEAGMASRYLIIAAVRTPEHLALQEVVTQIRLDLLRDKSLSSRFSPSYSLTAFHAQTDYLEVKRRFYKWISECAIDFKVAVIVAEKRMAYPSLQRDPSRMYATVSGQLLKRFLHVGEGVEVIFSRRDSSLKARETLQTVVDSARIDYATEHNISASANVRYYHNPHYSHGGLQIADYIAHALFQVFEHGKREWYEMIQNRIGYIQDVFNKKSYSRGNPL